MPEWVWWNELKSTHFSKLGAGDGGGSKNDERPVLFEQSRNAFRVLLDYCTCPKN
jgi:hypothetical protein